MSRWNLWNAVGFLLLLLTLGSSSAMAVSGVFITERQGDGRVEALRTGDEILSWLQLGKEGTCPESVGTVRTAFDGLWLVSEKLPQSALRLTLLRENKLHEITVTSQQGPFEISPLLPPTSERLLEGIEALLVEGETNAALSHWRNRSPELALSQEARLWILLQFFTKSQKPLSDEDVSSLKRDMERHWDSVPKSEPLLREEITRYFSRLGDFESGLREARDWLRVEASFCEESWRSALAQYFVADMLYHLELPEQAEAKVRRAVQVQESTPSPNVALADSLTLLGSVMAMQGETSESLQILERALDLYSLATGNLEGYLRLLLRIANLEQWLGNLKAAEEHLAGAQRLLDENTFGVDLTAETLIESGRLAESTGREELAEDFFLAVLNLEASGLTRGGLLTSALRALGDQAFKQESFEVAEAYYQRILTIDKERGVVSWSAALERLGLLALKRGAWQKAREHFEQMIELLRHDYDGSTLHATTLLHLARVFIETEDLQKAEDLLLAAHEIFEESQQQLLLANTLRRLSDLELKRDQMDRAVKFQESAVEILKNALPSSAYTAFFIGRLGSLAQQAGRREKAVKAYRDAIQILESLSFRLGYIANTDLEFRNQFRDIYRAYVDLLVEMEELNEAFAVLEAVRARSFLAILAERDLDLWRELPTALQERLEENAKAYDSTVEKLWRAPTETSKERQAIKAQLEQNLNQREEILRSIRASHPEIASLRYPKPLDLEAIQNTLAPDTVMLSYSINRSNTHLFVLTRTDFTTHNIAVGEEALERMITALRDLILGSSSKGIIGQHRRDQAEMVGRQLYDLLLSPVRSQLDQAERLFIVPDGSLHFLPWAALSLPPTESEPRSQYLIEKLPLHLSSSGTVFAAIKAKARPDVQRDGLFVALADPEPLRLEIENPQDPSNITRSFLDSGQALSPLPASRLEVNQLRKVYPHARILLGSSASEEAVKNLGENTRYLHFATHSLIDERRPLQTAIVLSRSQQPSEDHENGLLQVWEITEQLRFDADLVVLSACETALGKKVYGEGMIGLTRAFHHAGAQSVMASLWRISDESTAKLIESFYIHLKDGASKIEALRKAQMELIELSRSQYGSNSLGPYHWAAFQIYGNWR